MLWFCSSEFPPHPQALATGPSSARPTPIFMGPPGYTPSHARHTEQQAKVSSLSMAVQVARHMTVKFQLHCRKPLGKSGGLFIVVCLYPKSSLSYCEHSA
jgi:hypothetical protein